MYLDVVILNSSNGMGYWTGLTTQPLSKVNEVYARSSELWNWRRNVALLQVF